jgi:hypothetical protein
MADLSDYKAERGDAQREQRVRDQDWPNLDKICLGCSCSLTNTYYLFEGLRLCAACAEETLENCCKEHCPLCNGLCRGIKEHIEETDVDLHSCENKHVWQHGNTDLLAIRDDSLYEKQFKLPSIWNDTERLLYSFKLGLITTNEYKQEYLALTDVSWLPDPPSPLTQLNDLLNDEERMEATSGRFADEAKRIAYTAAMYLNHLGNCKQCQSANYREEMCLQGQKLQADYRPQVLELKPEPKAESKAEPVIINRNIRF